MSPTNYKTPGVYNQEESAFPNSIVAVETAVPAFIGYTAQAVSVGKSLINVPTRINSLAEFVELFCQPDPAKPHSPQYYLVPLNEQSAAKSHVVINGKSYNILPDPNTIYYLYNSVRLFYENGGGPAYIVSVGGYGKASKAPANAGTQLVNPNVKLSDLQAGLDALLKELEPTLYICPEATLLSVEDNATLMQAMLVNCDKLQCAISLFDVIGAKSPEPAGFMDDITTFRNSVGTNFLNYGAAYYPFIATTVTSTAEIDYTNLFGGDDKQLQQVLDPNASNQTLTDIFNNIAAGVIKERDNHNALSVASTDYQAIINIMVADVNLLPPSGAMAGIITLVDNTQGVWKAPANVSVEGATGLSINLSSQQQDLLNVDATSGKSINVIRDFPTEGIMVWGARTLDGNSQDWRYINVRRTLIMIEQSVKLGVRSLVFEPNDANTWVKAKSMIEDFLLLLWRQGALSGSKPADAYNVQVGLGATMTPQDILDGKMNISVALAVTRPAEFIIITFQQQMQQS